MPASDHAEPEDDRRIAALILRGAQLKAVQAKEEGNSAYLANDKHARGQINERLLIGEINQARSFNKRAGVDAAKLPSLPSQTHDTPLQRETTELDRMYVQRAHQMRESSAVAKKAIDKWSESLGGKGQPDRNDTFWDHEKRKLDGRDGQLRGGPCADFLKGRCHDDDCRFSHDPRDLFGDLSTDGKRQRIGGNGIVVDIAKAEAEAARQADEDLELANPLLRGPNKAKRKVPSPVVEEAAMMRPLPNSASDRVVPVECWASRNLRVRIVDESGVLRDSHLKKGVVKHVDIQRCCVDIKVDDGIPSKLLGVPMAKLETVVSRACKNVEIVRGPRRGMLGVLVCRDPKLNAARVRLGRGDNCTDVDLALDDVCEYA